MRRPFAKCSKAIKALIKFNSVKMIFDPMGGGGGGDWTSKESSFLFLFYFL